MGWNSWNHFSTGVTDAVVRAQADAMVSTGMRNAGYTYVNIDDTWEGQRDSQGFIHPNDRFPDMKALADYVHRRGLKLGIYSSPGLKTCAGFEGSFGHEDEDAATYAKWGVDYLKYDLCSFHDLMLEASSADAAHRMMVAAYTNMHAALAKTGRPIVYSVCEYGLDDVWIWGASVGGNLWRTTFDIADTYQRMAEIGFAQVGLSKHAGPGHWNDPDMLEVGNGGMSTDEYQTHISLWALLAAPLIAGNDLTSMTSETKSLLLNKDVIAIDQDLAGIAGDRLSAEGDIEIWMRPLAGDRRAVGIFNRGVSAKQVTITPGTIGLSRASTARDVWNGDEVSIPETGHDIQIAAHGVVLFKISGN